MSLCGAATDAACGRCVSSSGSAETQRWIALVILRAFPSLTFSDFDFPRAPLVTGSTAEAGQGCRVGVPPLPLCAVEARRRALCSSRSHLPADSFHSFSSLKRENHLYNEREIQTVYRFSSTVEVCVWHEGCNLAFCSLNQIVFVFSVKLNCKNCLYNVEIIETLLIKWTRPMVFLNQKEVWSCFFFCLHMFSTSLFHFVFPWIWR